MTKTVEEHEWHGHHLIKQVVAFEDDKPIPFLTVLPTDASEPLPCIVALHGFTARKEDWIDLKEGATGGHLTNKLVQSGYAVIAIDLFAHGENHTDEPVNYDELSEEGWDTFFAQSLKTIELIMNSYVQTELFDQERVGFLSYSVGGLFGFWLANRQAAFKTMVLCVPPVDKDEDDGYAPYNNLSNDALPTLMIVAEEDEYIPFADSQWLFEQLPMMDKQLLSYQSGHGLPLDYVPAASAWIKSRL